MKTVKNLGSVRINGASPSPHLKKLDPKASTVRVPLIFLIDISGSMGKFLPTINQTLNKLMNDIYSGEGTERFMVDFAIITFGGTNPNAKGDTIFVSHGGTIQVAREFDLLHPGEKFQISKCEGRTPLSAAMLYAYWYGAVRKKQYKENGMDYNQPVVVIMSDFFENVSVTVEVDGFEYSDEQLYNEMSELYSTAFYTTYKQYTYVITPPGQEVNHDRINKLKVNVVDVEHLDIASVLTQVLKEYKASVELRPTKDEEDLIEEFENGEFDDSPIPLLNWPPKRVESPLPDDLGDIVIVEC